MNQGNSGGIVALFILVILVLLGIHEERGLGGAKQDVLAFFEILK